MKPVRAVAANPGSHLFPTREMAFPYGFGGLPERLADEKVLKAYLAVPLRFTSARPTLTPARRASTQAGRRSGKGRRGCRGHRCFEMGQQLARAKGWPFHWRLVEASGVGHSAVADVRPPRVPHGPVRKMTRGDADTTSLSRPTGEGPGVQAGCPPKSFLDSRPGCRFFLVDPTHVRRKPARTRSPTGDVRRAVVL